MLNAIDIKRRLSESDDFTEEQAERLADELANLAESQLVTDEELTSRLRRQTITIILANLAGTAALLALFGAV